MYCDDLRRLSCSRVLDETVQVVLSKVTKGQNFLIMLSIGINDPCMESSDIVCVDLTYLINVYRRGMVVAPPF